MSGQGMSISQAARALGVSARTIRRYIKAGRIPAELVSGHFGEEYRIPKLPLELYPTKPEEKDHTLSQNPGQALGQAMDIIRELQEKNLTLAAQLGAATERIRSLENQVKLLTAARRPWWKRLFS
jgi:MerR family copper efflux transcriptional regulator